MLGGWYSSCGADWWRTSVFSRELLQIRPLRREMFFSVWQTQYEKEGQRREQIVPLLPIYFWCSYELANISDWKTKWTYKPSSSTRLCVSWWSKMVRYKQNCEKRWSQNAALFHVIYDFQGLWETIVVSDLVEPIFIKLDDHGEEIDNSYIYSLVFLQALCLNVLQRKLPVCSSSFGSKAGSIYWLG